MNIYNYLYNISSLKLFIRMGHRITTIKPEFSSFWIHVGPNFSMYFAQHRHSFYFNYVRLAFAGSPSTKHEYIRYEYDKYAKEMKLFWNLEGGLIYDEHL